MTLLDWLQARYPTAKRQTFKRMVEAGRVMRNQQPARRLKDPIHDEDVIRVIDVPRPVLKTDLQIIHEDADLLVVNKPAGLLTSTVPREPRPTLLVQVRGYLAQREPQARVGLIHRLDRDASGLLVFSKSNAAYESLKWQFFNHTVERVYVAVIDGKPNELQRVIRSRLVELPDGKVVITTAPGKGQIAVTEYRLLRTEAADAGVRSLLRIKLQTGRKHQIRAQLAAGGLPIVNDPVYNTAQLEGRLMLAAILLSLGHPTTGKRITWEIPIPKELSTALKSKSRMTKFPSD